MGRHKSDNPSAGVTFSATKSMIDTLSDLYDEALKRHRTLRNRSEFFIWLLEEPIRQLCREWNVPTPVERETRRASALRLDAPPSFAKTDPPRRSSGGPGGSVGPLSARDFYARPAAVPAQSGLPDGFSPEMLDYPLDWIPHLLSEPGAKRPPKALLIYHQQKFLEAKRMYQEHVWPNLLPENRRESYAKFEAETMAKYPVPVDFDAETYVEG